MKVDISRPLSEAAESENDKVRTSCAKVLQKVSRDCKLIVYLSSYRCSLTLSKDETRSKMLHGGVINSLINMIKSRHDAERLEATKALYGFVRHSKLFETPYRFCFSKCLQVTLEWHSSKRGTCGQP